MNIDFIQPQYGTNYYSLWGNTTHINFRETRDGDSEGLFYHVNDWQNVDEAYLDKDITSNKVTIYAKVQSEWLWQGKGDL